MGTPVIQRRVVITGGPCSGKTTLIQGFARRGFATVPEAAIQVIQELVATLGLEEQARWRARESRRFQEMILERQRAMEAAVPVDAPWIFHDRGVHDGLAYLLHYGAAIPPDLREAYGPCRYHRVFVLDTLGAFDARADTGRTEDRAEALRIRDRIRAVYEEHGVGTDSVPEMDPLAREEAILKALGAPVRRD